LLPTPLSPARGCCGVCEPSGEPSCLLIQQRTWRPMSTPCAHVPRKVRLASGIVTGARTGIRLCFAVVLLSLGRNPFFVRLPFGIVETVMLLVGGSSTLVLDSKVLFYSYRHPVSRP
jgi:hypothetical protein